MKPQYLMLLFGIAALFSFIAAAKSPSQPITIFFSAFGVVFVALVVWGISLLRNQTK